MAALLDGNSWAHLSEIKFQKRQKKVNGRYRNGYNSSNNENQNSSSSVNSSGYNSSQSRKGNYQQNRENNAKSGQLEMKSFINVDDGSNLTDISPVLTCIRTLSESDAIWNENRSNCIKSVSLKQLKSENDVPKEDGFYFAVSLRDGACLFTSSAITDHLGYPKDMLNGQCFMNFVFQKDHITFANHLTQGLNACFIQGERDESHLIVNSFFCRLRAYHGLKFGYSMADKKTQYKPFKITLHINELIVDDMCVEKPSATLCVKATATVMSSVYSIPEEIPAMTSFSTRHTASCHFSHIDFSAIPYLGYLPQDMIGISVFDFYHIDDMPQLKDIYELVVKEHGSSFRSKPYRFKVHNGCYIMLETEWSCFINPWSHKLEFVVGQHRVLKGPPDVNIFNEFQTEENIASDEIVKESMKIQKEIKTLLSQSMKNASGNKSKRFCNKRKRDLASFVYNCIDEGYVGNKKVTSDKQDIEDRSNSDPDSVVMGDISPYREVNDSSVSSETPPTVQQLRYQENIERFFASQPKTYSDGSDESNKNEKSSSGEEYQGSSSGSGNVSGNASKEPNTSKKYENKIQESSSNSSKCNMSSFTTGDSGYGKSLEKDGHNNNTDKSLMESCNQTWKKNSTDCINNNTENFSSYLALTEETLSAHNRINHKHLKQHQRKNKSSMGHSNAAIKDSNWFPSKEVGHSKHKKCLHSHNLTVSTPTQTDINVTSSPHISVRYPQPSVPSTSADPSSVSTHIPQVSYSCLIPPNNFSSAAPTPFFIPGNPFWSCRPSASTGEVPTPSFPFPVISPCGHHTGVVPPSTGMPYSTFPVSNFNPYSGIPFGVQSSGVTATSLSTTTTTTVASGSTHSFKNSIANSLNTNKQTDSVSKMKGIDNRKQDSKEVNECDMQVDDTRSSSYTQSSSLQSVDKEEDMDFEIKKNHSGPPRSDKVELTSEIAYRYQMDIPDMNEVLKKDMEALKSMQQPDLVNKQLQMLQNELESENENKIQAENDFCMTEPVMLGLTTEDDVNEELEYREECLLQLMCEDS